MKYEDMSDFEINKRVAMVAGKNIKFISVDVDDNEVGIIIGQKHTRQRLPFDPCNNPADAWPIIIHNHISIECVTVSRYTFTYRAYHSASFTKSTHENPLRAAMIVFLKMQEKV